jgi:hypothetical protein
VYFEGMGKGLESMANTNDGYETPRYEFQDAILRMNGAILSLLSLYAIMVYTGTSLPDPY